MTTPQERRQIRIKNDFKEMQNIKGPIVDWKPLIGVPPYVEAYELTIKIRTIISPQPSYRDLHVIRVTIPPNYPFAAPLTVMQTHPQPYHPNWFSSDKRWCYGTWDIAEGLGHHVLRMIRTLQFDPEITNPDSPANSVAKEWYLNNRHRGWFPCDRQVLPDPTKDKFVIQGEKKQFKIE
jgi:ubiquitin-protein ligase